jgi:hypothetical protein
MKYQLVPPHDHRRYIAETAINVFKAHFISILCGCEKSFPLYLWDRLLPQAEHTLNMLRTSTMTPSVSVYAYHRANMTTMQTLLHHWDAKLRHTSPQEFARHGRLTQQADTTLITRGSTTAAMKSTSVTPRAFTHASRFSSNTSI